ncbi:VanZ family protein [Metabacillus sp. KIGAM252]|uniref:VanZ family protein n=2 Tax=Metabacillus flavus TaxID=2823519 RepID=A0ABS5LBX5_9BACI|nr:VanZ family protein [Metabacillus flavus]
MKYTLLIVPYIQILLRIPYYLQNYDYKLLMFSHFITSIINSTFVAILLFFLLKNTKINNFLSILVFGTFSFYLNFLFTGTIGFPFHSIVLNQVHPTYLFTDKMQLPINIVPILPMISTLNNSLALLYLFYNLMLLAPATFTILYFGWIKNIKKILLLAFISSIFIELIQLIEMVILSFYEIDELRAADINDVILNFISGVIGIIVFKVYFKFSTKFKSDKTFLVFFRS